MTETPTTQKGPAMSDLIMSAVRTFVPWLVGIIVGWLASAGVDVGDDSRTQLTAVVAFLVALVYYLLVRVLERRWPKLGVLLGVPKAPAYGQSNSPVDQS